MRYWMLGLQHNFCLSFFLPFSLSLSFCSPFGGEHNSTHNTKVLLFPVFMYNNCTKLKGICMYSLSYYLPHSFRLVRIILDWAFLMSTFVQRWFFWVWVHFSTHPLHYSLSESQRKSRNYFHTNVSSFAYTWPRKLYLTADFSFVIFHQSSSWCFFH